MAQPVSPVPASPFSHKLNEVDPEVKKCEDKLRKLQAKAFKQLKIKEDLEHELAKQCGTEDPIHADGQYKKFQSIIAYNNKLRKDLSDKERDREIVEKMYAETSGDYNEVDD